MPSWAKFIVLDSKYQSVFYCSTFQTAQSFQSGHGGLIAPALPDFDI